MSHSGCRGPLRGVSAGGDRPALPPRPHDLPGPCPTISGACTALPGPRPPFIPDGAVSPIPCAPSGLSGRSAGHRRQEAPSRLGHSPSCGGPIRCPRDRLDAFLPSSVQKYPPGARCRRRRGVESSPCHARGRGPPRAATTGAITRTPCDPCHWMVLLRSATYSGFEQFAKTHEDTRTRRGPGRGRVKGADCARGAPIRYCRPRRHAMPQAGLGPARCAGGRCDRGCGCTTGGLLRLALSQAPVAALA